MEAEAGGGGAGAGANASALDLLLQRNERNESDDDDVHSLLPKGPKGRKWLPWRPRAKKEKAPKQEGEARSKLSPDGIKAEAEEGRGECGDAVKDEEPDSSYRGEMNQNMAGVFPSSASSSSSSSFASSNIKKEKKAKKSLASSSSSSSVAMVKEEDEAADGDIEDDDSKQAHLRIINDLPPTKWPANRSLSLPLCSLPCPSPLGHFLLASPLLLFCAFLCVYLRHPLSSSFFLSFLVLSSFFSLLVWLIYHLLSGLSANSCHCEGEASPILSSLRPRCPFFVSLSLFGSFSTRFLACQQTRATVKAKPNLNTHITSVLERMEAIYGAIGDDWREYAYRKAVGVRRCLDLHSKETGTERV